MSLGNFTFIFKKQAYCITYIAPENGTQVSCTTDIARTTMWFNSRIMKFDLYKTSLLCRHRVFKHAK